MVLFSLGTLRAAGVKWIRKQWVLSGAIAAFAVLVIIELRQVTWGAELASIREYGVLKYAAAEGQQVHL